MHIKKWGPLTAHPSHLKRRQTTLPTASIQLQAHPLLFRTTHKAESEEWKGMAVEKHAGEGTVDRFATYNYIWHACR